MEELLRVEHLRKIFTAADGNDFPAVDDVTFSVGEGEKVAIIGESGSGKTTVAKMVTRLLDATSGSIILEGQDITKASGRKLRQAYGKIQMVFQMPVESFDPRQTLGDGITDGVRVYKERDRTKNFWGPTQAGISLVWTIGGNK